MPTNKHNIIFLTSHITTYPSHDPNPPIVTRFYKKNTSDSDPTGSRTKKQNNKWNCTLIIMWKSSQP